MGGQYEPHFDFSRVRSHFQLFLGGEGETVCFERKLLKLSSVKTLNV